MERNTKKVTASRTGNGERKKPKLNPQKFLISIAVILFSIYCIYTMVWQQISLRKKVNQIEELKATVEQLNQETEKLNQEIENLDDPAYLEKMAREKLGMVRPNERVFVDANKSEENQGD